MTIRPSKAAGTCAAKHCLSSGTVSRGEVCSSTGKALAPHEDTEEDLGDKRRLGDDVRRSRHTKKAIAQQVDGDGGVYRRKTYGCTASNVFVCCCRWYTYARAPSQVRFGTEDRAEVINSIDEKTAGARRPVVFTTNSQPARFRADRRPTVVLGRIAPHVVERVEKFTRRDCLSIHIVVYFFRGVGPPIGSPEQPAQVESQLVVGFVGRRRHHGFPGAQGSENQLQCRG